MLKTFFFCFIITQAIGRNHINALESGPWKIVGGTEVPSNVALYQASLRTDFNTHFCGASIISKRTILTAAHCLFGQSPKHVNVVIGTTNLKLGGDRYKPSSFKIHENYNPFDNVNDIAMIYLYDDIQFHDRIEIIKPGSSFLDANIPVNLTGWGLTTFPGLLPNQLQIAELKTISNNECNFRIKDIRIGNGQICTLVHPGIGSCKGDSGGPLVANKEQVGIVSMGYPCALGYPDIFTRVSYYSEWIEKNKQ